MYFILQDLEKIKIGENFNVVVKIKNKSDNERHIKCALSAASVYYTGVKARQIIKQEGQFVMKPNSSKYRIETNFSRVQ